MRDFVEVMCLSQGLSAESLSTHLSGTAGTAAAVTEGAQKFEKSVATPGIVPPRREIGKFI